MLKTHGGFRVGDKVDVKIYGKWQKGWKILEFHMLYVRLEKPGNPFERPWFSIHEIRHPHLVRKSNGN